MTALIHGMKAREILDSRGYPTVEVDLFLRDGRFARASCPSGASTGSFEALERRDGVASYYNGKGVLKVISDIHNRIRPALLGQDALDQTSIDRLLCELDGTQNKASLGANAILPVSLAVSKLAALHKGISLFDHIHGLMGGTQKCRLPRPMFNIVNGGVHANSGLSIQEFMIIPVSARTFAEALHIGSNVFHTLEKELSRRGISTAVGAEGGFAPPLATTKEALDLILKAIECSGYKPFDDIQIALDVAASELFKDKVYHLDGRIFQGEELIQFYLDLLKNYPITSLEDAFHEEDWKNWSQLTQQVSKGTCQIVGDDIYVTNPLRLNRGIREGASTAILIKPNQIGTLTQTLETIQIAQKSTMNCVVSHRSGETEDTFIADLAVGASAGQIKSGSLSRTDRLCKYNQLLRIEEELFERGDIEILLPF